MCESLHGQELIHTAQPHLPPVRQITFGTYTTLQPIWLAENVNPPPWYSLVISSMTHCAV